MLTRRALLGFIAAAPFIVRAGVIMPVKAFQAAPPFSFADDMVRYQTWSIDSPRPVVYAYGQATRDIAQRMIEKLGGQGHIKQLGANLLGAK